jgi:hypothetical protein
MHGVPLRAPSTIVNLFDTTALYNFLSTFAGTHFVTPEPCRRSPVFDSDCD